MQTTSDCGGGLWKKKDRFLRIDWGGEHSVVFGGIKTVGGVTAAKLQLLITQTIRQVKEAGADENAASVSATAAETSFENDGTDIADAIQKLGGLRDQGILTEDEFSAKKLSY